MTPSLARIGALVAALCCAGPTAAALVSYNVGGTIAGSPLDGQNFGGYFTIEEAPGGLLGVPLPLHDLEFRFNGVTYDEGDVDGAAAFDPSGFLLGVRSLFGTACTGGVPNLTCDLSAGADAWVVGSSNGAASLSFSLAGVIYSADASFTLRESNPVPEPGGLALALGALAALAGARRLQSAGSGVRQCHGRSRPPCGGEPGAAGVGRRLAA